MSKLKELIDRLCPDGVEYKSLKSIAIIKNGKDYKHCATGDIPVYGSGGIMTYIDQSTYNQPTVLLPRKGSIGKIYYVDTPFWNVDTVYYTDINLDIIIPKFLYYFLTTVDLEKMNCGKGAVPSLTQEILYRIKIPIPPLEVQEEIVRILDKFDSYAAELQAELQARKEQYEYYRNLLLTFNPSACGCGTDGEQEIRDVTPWGGQVTKLSGKLWKKFLKCVMAILHPKAILISGMEGRFLGLEWKTLEILAVFFQILTNTSHLKQLKARDYLKKIHLFSQLQQP